MSSIVNDNQHEYVYNGLSNFSIIDNVGSIIVNVSDCGLPYIEEDMSEDTRIQFFHKSYYSIVMGLSIIDELLIRYDKNYLNQSLGRLFKYYSDNNCIIKDIDMFRELLIFSRDTYYNECSNYSKGVECGSLLHLVIFEINLIRFINIIKECLEIDEHFSLMVNINSNMSKLSLDTLRKCMKFRYNTGLFIHMFSDENKNNNYFTRIKVVNL